MPNQAKYLDDIANDVMTKYRPTNVYSTGHSLGGYLAQFFAVNSMAQTDVHKQAFKRSALFNPAVLKTDSNSPAYLHQARSEAEKFARTPQPDHSDLSEAPKESYKTNSYVITGEWVSSGFHGAASAAIIGGSTVGGVAAGSIFGPIGTLVGAIAGAVTGKKVGDVIHFDGLGYYPNTVFLISNQEIYGANTI